nr:hypothetical protein [Tanacetum cinerariifolium]
VSVAQARKNMIIYLKNIAEFKMDFFKGMSYEDIRPLFEEEYNKGRKIADIDADAEVNLENVYNLDMAHKEIVLSMKNVTDANVKEVVEEMVNVITTAKIIVDEGSIAGGELNAANKEPVSVAPTNITFAQPKDHVPTTSNDPLPSCEDRMQLKELMVLCINLLNKVLDLENKVIEMKSSYKAKIAELESRVEKLKEENMSLTIELKSINTMVESPAIKEIVVESKQGRKIADIDADAEVNLKNVYNLDMAHKEIVLSMKNVTDVDVKEVVEEMVDIITTAKIIVDEGSIAGGELNAANKEPVSAAPTNITSAQPSEATKTTVDITTAPKAKRIVFHDI